MRCLKARLPDEATTKKRDSGQASDWPACVKLIRIVCSMESHQLDHKPITYNYAVAISIIYAFAASYSSFDSSCLSQSQQPLQVHTLWSLDRQTQRTIPYQLCKRSKTSRDAKRGSIIQCLMKAVMVEKHP